MACRSCDCEPRFVSQLPLVSVDSSFQSRSRNATPHLAALPSHLCHDRNSFTSLTHPTPLPQARLHPPPPSPTLPRVSLPTAAPSSSRGYAARAPGKSEGGALVRPRAFLIRASAADEVLSRHGASYLVRYSFAEECL